MDWVGPPTTNSGILGIYRGPNIIASISSGHYKSGGANLMYGLHGC